jgi:hypothetical protein
MPKNLISSNVAVRTFTGKLGLLPRHGFQGLTPTYRSFGVAAHGQLSGDMLGNIQSAEDQDQLDVSRIIETLSTVQDKELGYHEFLEGQALADELLHYLS